MRVKCVLTGLPWSKSQCKDSCVDHIRGGAREESQKTGVTNLLKAGSYFLGPD